MNLRELLFLVLCTALCGACSHGEMQRRLAEVDSLTDANYDSALVLLARMDSLPMRRADRMYLELLRGKAMNKAVVPFTTDSVMRRVAAYYDRYGSANRRLLAHYVLGCAYRDMKSAPRALEEYQKAVSLADTARADCDLSTLMRVHSQMAGLYMQLRLSEEALYEDSLAQQLCYIMGDNNLALIFKEDACSILYREGRYKECIKAAQNLYDQYMSLGLKDDAALTCIFLARTSVALEEYTKAQQYLNIYAQSAYVQGDNRKIAGRLSPMYICKANCLLGLGMPDSAEIFFRKALTDMHILQNEYAVYDGLSRVYTQKQIPDSLYKYARLLTASLQEKFNSENSDATIRAKSLYGYGVEQRIARQKTIEAAHWRTALAVTLLVLCMLLYITARRRVQRKVLARRLDENIKLLDHYELIMQHLRDEKEQLSASIESAENEMERAKSETEHAKTHNEALQKEIAHVQEQIKKLQAEKEEKESKIVRLEENYNHLKDQVNEMQDRLVHRSREKLRQLNDSEIAQRLRDYLKNPVTKPALSESDWQELRRTVGEIYPSFYGSLTDRFPISESEYRVCMLVLAGFSPDGINVLLFKSSSYASNTRARLHAKIFGKEGKGADFDRKIALFAEKGFQ